MNECIDSTIRIEFSFLAIDTFRLYVIHDANQTIVVNFKSTSRVRTRFRLMIHARTSLISWAIFLAVCELRLETMIEYLKRTKWKINRSSRRRDRCSEQERKRANLVHTDWERLSRFRFRCSLAMIFKSRLSFMSWHDSHALFSFQDVSSRWLLKMNEATRWFFQLMRRK